MNRMSRMSGMSSMSRMSRITRMGWMRRIFKKNVRIVRFFSRKLYGLYGFFQKSFGHPEIRVVSIILNGKGNFFLENHPTH